MRTRLFALALALGLVTAGCAANTELVNMWRDPQYTGPPLKSAFVIVLRRDPVRRRQWEDSFVTQLAKHGVDAMPSYRVYPDELPDTATVQEDVDRHGYDAIIMSSSEGSSEVASYRPGYVTTEPVTVFQPMWGTYVTYYRDVYHPGGTETNTSVHIRTDVWRRKGRLEGTLAWSGTSATIDPTSTTSFSHEVAELVSHELAKYQIIQ